MPGDGSSGPIGTRTAASAASARGEPAVPVTAIVRQPPARAAVTAATSDGFPPEALTPTTAIRSGVTPRGRPPARYSAADRAAYSGRPAPSKAVRQARAAFSE